MNERIRLLVLGLTALGLTGRADFNPRAYRYIKTVDTAEVTRETIVAAVLDSEVYEHSRDDLADLRVRDQDGMEVPFVIEKHRVPETTYEERPVAMEISQFEELEGNRFRVTARRGEPDLETAPTHLVIHSPLRDYEKRVRVSARRGNEPWQILVENQPVFDYSRYIDVRNNRIEIPPGPFDQYRIEVEHVTDARSSAFTQLSQEIRDGKLHAEIGRKMVERRDFRIDRLTFGRRVRRDGVQCDRLRVYDIAGFDVATGRDAAGGYTTVTIDTRREPLCAFELKTESRNFSRAARIEVPEKGPPRRWRQVTSGRVSRFDFRGLRHAQLRLTFPEHRAPAYRLVVADGDSPGLTVTGVKAEGKIYRLLWLAVPERRYELLFGCDQAEAPAYDTASVLHTLMADKRYDVQTQDLGRLMENRRYGKLTGLNALLQSKLALGSGIAVILAVLGWGIFSALRSIENLPADDGEPPPS